jgi:hypothetical protein
MREICSSGLKRGRVIPPYSTQFLAIRSRGSALQFFSFFAKFIAEGTIHEQKKEKRASDSLGDAVTKLYKVEVRCMLGCAWIQGKS